VFEKFLELVARIIYGRRIRQIDQIGEAAKLAGQGEPEAALMRLAALEGKRLHPKARSYLSLTKGRILDTLGRVEEAEAHVIAACKLDPGNMRAHLDLAVMSGRKFQFKNARARLEKLTEEAEPEVASEAEKMLVLVKSITSGKKAKELKKRAAKMAARRLSPNDTPAGLPADLKLLDRWISRHPEEAEPLADEIAILLGESAVNMGGAWRISLSLTHSLVELRDGRVLHPFETVAARFSSGQAALARSAFSQMK
jgi:tetratricopeptide (TPR) repeat protein